jgi:hypothetical protein
MRYFIYIFILVFSISCINIKNKENPNITVNATLIRTYDTICNYKPDTKQTTFDINISIKNNSNKPISFWIMTCSWMKNFIVNNDYIGINWVDCDSNFPKVRQLKPNDNIVFKTSCIKYNTTTNPNIKTTKFGFIFIEKNKCQEMHDFDEIIGDKSQHEIIIWSNPLYLNKNK